jgi:soluble lytic murein transglycosylase-like protein
MPNELSPSKVQETSGSSGTTVLWLFLGLLLVLMLAANSMSKPTNASLDGMPTASSASFYSTLAAQDAAQAGLPPDLFVRQIHVESGFNPNAQSPAGAEGIAQFMPATAAGLGIDPWNPVQALQAAAQVMAGYTQHYGSYTLALAAYNCGSGCTNSALSRCGSAWMRCIPTETQAYIRIITEV